MASEKNIEIVSVLSRFLKINLTGNINKDGFVKNTAGLMALGCLTVGLYGVAHEKKVKSYGSAFGGSFLFGVIYYWRDRIESGRLKDDKKSDNSQDDKTVEPTDFESNLPAFLSPCGDVKPIRHTLNELAHASVADVIPLFGSYVYKGDIDFFFSMANKGKTICGIQISIDIATGQSSLVQTKKTVPSQDVHYFLFEMNQSQMKKRLRGGKESEPVIHFPSNVHVHECKGCFMTVDDFLIHLAKMAEFELSSDSVIVIDTITDACPNFFSNEASHVINSLRTIQAHALKVKNITITFLIEAHTKKMHEWDPLELESLKGGVNQANLADSVFALGQTKDKQQRYLKLLKCRNDEIPETVDLIRIADSPYLHFTHIGKAKEKDVLPVKPKASNKSMPRSSQESDIASEKQKVYERFTQEERVALYRLKCQGKSYTEILSKSDIIKGRIEYPSQVGRLFDQMKKIDGLPSIPSE